MELYDAIFYRKSIRNYSNKNIKEHIMKEVNETCSNITYLNEELNIKAHVIERGHLVHFLIGKECKIKAPHYILVTSNKGEDYLQNIGFAMEEVVLQLTSLGLATCWIECKLKREDILEFVELEELEEENDDNNIEQPYAIIAFGYPEKSERLFKSKNSIPDREKVKSISKNLDKNFEKLVEAVRVAPSIKNCQPWFLYNDGLNFHLYEKHQKKSLQDMSKISMGIALRHFDIACKSEGIEVEYEKLQAKKKRKKDYFISMVLKK